jgi:hypothetical protein
MLNHHRSSKNLTKIAIYVLFIIATFSLSLLFIPYEFFFFSAVVVLIALRGVEKEVMRFRKQ